MSQKLIILYILSGLGVLIVIVAIWYYIAQMSTPSPQVLSVSPSPTASATATATTSPLNPALTSYTNNTLGIKLDIPKTAYGPTSCVEKVNADGSKSGDTKGGQVPVKAFESNDFVAIGFTYSYSTLDAANQCQKITTSVATINDALKQGGVTWVIKVKTVGDDNALDAFLKTEFGKGCSVGAKTASAQAGVFDVEIKGDGKELDQTDCLVNYKTVIKYYPAKKVVAKWDLGQDYTFVADDLSTNSKATIYDTPMTESFRFL